jgi:hypothetical protein
VASNGHLLFGSQCELLLPIIFSIVDDCLMFGSDGYLCGLLFFATARNDQEDSLCCHVSRRSTLGESSKNKRGVCTELFMLIANSKLYRKDET